MDIAHLASQLSLGALLETVLRELGPFDLVDHWQQGEFHHDLVISLRNRGALPGAILVVSTNCNAGVKEVLCFEEPPRRGALWHDRCPDNPEFAGALPPVLALARTRHWFDPCRLLGPDARSEYREEFRVRQPGGGWRLKRTS
jgi:hypothetical protein